MKNLLLIMLTFLLFTSCKTTEEDNEANDRMEEYAENPQRENEPAPRVSLDWEGTYSGVLPCEDCTGIETYLTIEEDLSYELVQRRVKTIDTESEEKETSGTFSWNGQGTAISLPALEGELSLEIGEFYLIPLDSNGNEIPAEPGNNFRLLKQ